jgi:hypothetical protein
MVLKVYTVVQTTRLVLPDTMWGQNVIQALARQGYQVEATDQDPDSCKRGPAEMARMNELLDKTGL